MAWGDCPGNAFIYCKKMYILACQKPLLDTKIYDIFGSIRFLLFVYWMEHIFLILIQTRYYHFLNTHFHLARYSHHRQQLTLRKFPPL